MADLEVRAVVGTAEECAAAQDTDAPADVAAEVRSAEPVAAVADAVELVQAADAQALAVVAPAPAVEVAAAAVEDAAVATGDAGLRTGWHSATRRLRAPRRRPGFYLAAAVVGAVGLGTSTAGDGVAQAGGPTSVSTSVSVAEELGIRGEDLSPAAQAAVIESDAAVLLDEVTASRTAREAEEAAAAQAQAEADRIASEAAAAAAAEAARPRTVLPVDGARLTSTFGPRWGTLHAGIDLAAPIGTPEYAVADGVVLEAGPASGYGLVVYVQHENGDVTVYGHMEEILVEPGQVVRAGETIALLGNRGQSTGPHLHLEVHVGGIDGERVDPLPWLRERGVAV
ncbi:M23 family metallopeptidase [Geodermatophilus maliterrae]|uniref:M23 family metallopeptidase n=1 Tax=Geodermatophilus maliterrae TaxID=3162531 RepID=A0ABV3XLV7_9ACTN